MWERPVQGRLTKMWFFRCLRALSRGIQVTKKKLMVLVLATVLAPSAVTAASTTHGLNVSATVVGNCRFNDAGPTALTFGSIDPTSTTDKTATANVSFRCTNGTTSSIASAVGANDVGGVHHMSDGTNLLPYAVGFGGTDAQLGSGHGAAGNKTLVVTGTVAVADFQNAAASTGYVDTLVLTISP